MSRIDGEVRGALAAVAALTDCNPFVPERVELEKQILGAAFVPFGVVWSADADAGVFDPNLPRLRGRIEQLVGDVQARLAGGAATTPELVEDYRRAVFYLLWLRYEDALAALIKIPGAERTAARKVTCYERFAAEAVQFLAPLADAAFDAPHIFAVGFQARRAFHHIFRKIFGTTLPAARLRATVWQSIFTRHPERYRDGLHHRMVDIPTLITGESGTGKELVARAIALSQYIPFDAASQSFAAAPDAGFAPVNLAALSPTLIESELFGHRRGAFTGAFEDHAGELPPVSLDTEQEIFRWTRNRGAAHGMHTQLPQQQLHSVPTWQSCADGLHSLTGGIGVGVGAACVADEDNARIRVSTNTYTVRSVGIGKSDSPPSWLQMPSGRWPW